MSPSSNPPEMGSSLMSTSGDLCSIYLVAWKSSILPLLADSKVTFCHLSEPAIAFKPRLQAEKSAELGYFSSDHLHKF